MANTGTSFDTDAYDAIQAMFGEAFSVPEEEEIEGALEGEEYEQEVARRKAEEGKKVKRIDNGWRIIYVFMVVSVLAGIVSVLTLSTAYVVTVPVFYVVCALLPFLLWRYSTLFDEYNFHNKKMRCFYTVVVNAVLCFGGLLYSTAANQLIPYFAKLPVNEMVSVRANMNLARLVLILISVVPCVVMLLAVYKQRDNEIFKGYILKFKLAKEVDTRDEDVVQFSYDMHIVRDLATGVEVIIKMKDRFLHSLANGTTGTGKTSSLFTCAIARDFEQIMYNLEYLKKRIEQLIKTNKVVMKEPMVDDDFNINNFEPVKGAYVENEREREDGIGGFFRYVLGLAEDKIRALLHMEKEKRTVEEELEWLKKNVLPAGITTMAPTASFSDEVYDLAKKQSIKRVYRLDPTLGEDGRLKPGFKGFNPLYINPNLNRMEWLMSISQKAVLFADVCQSVFDESGSTDVYFESVNKNATVIASMTAMLVHPHMPGHKGEQPTPDTVRWLLADFSRFEPYLDKLVRLYAKKDRSGAPLLVNGKPDLGPFQMVYDRIKADFLGEGAAIYFQHCNGLRNIMDTFLTNPKIHNILCNKNSIDLDECLANGDIVLVNYALELGSDGKAFGRFFLLSYIQAVFRRPGNENTRIPNFFYVDELPELLHPQVARCFSLFRQFRVAMFVAIQSLSQMEQIESTKFLKQVLQGNCAHHFVFGRVATEEMQYYQELGGRSFQIKVQSGVKETSLNSDNPSVMYDNRETIERDYNFEGSDIRALDFQEVFVITVDNGSPKDAFYGKVSFLPGSRRVPKKAYAVNWKRYYHGFWFEEEEELCALPQEEVSSRQKMEKYRKGMGEDKFVIPSSEGAAPEDVPKEQPLPEDDEEREGPPTIQGLKRDIASDSYAQEESEEESTEEVEEEVEESFGDDGYGVDDCGGFTL